MLPPATFLCANVFAPLAATVFEGVGPASLGVVPIADGGPVLSFALEAPKLSGHRRVVIKTATSFV